MTFFIRFGITINTVMKKFVFFLILIPISCYAQLHDCGEKPTYNGSKTGNYVIHDEYKNYKKELEGWENCYSSFSDNFEGVIKSYFDSAILDPIEGIYLCNNNNGVNYCKVAITKSENGTYNEYFIERYGWRAGLMQKKAGDIVSRYEKTSLTNEYVYYQGKKSYNCKLSNNKIVFNVPYIGVFTFNKIYPIGEPIDAPNKTPEWLSQGSGVIISTDGYIITNYHVVKKSKQIMVDVYQGSTKSFNAKIISVDKKNDLALIKVDETDFSEMTTSVKYNLLNEAADVGTKVYSYGYPLSYLMGKEIKITDGIISSKTGFSGDITCYQISAPIQPGSSGGPLFDENANLIGINSSGLHKSLADNVGYTIKSSYILNFLDAVTENFSVPSNKTLKNYSLTSQIKELSNYVVLIKVR